MAVLLTLLAAAVATGGPDAQGVAHAAARTTIVSITFDDGHVSAHATLGMLRSRGLVATYYVTSGRVGTAPRFMTWAQIDELARAGNEIGGHTAHHVNLTKVDADHARREVCDDRQALIARGYGPVISFAYPEAGGDSTAEQVVRDCGYASAREVGLLRGATSCLSCPRAESIPPADPYALRTPRAATTSTTLQDLQHSVLGAERNGGGWVPLVFHGVCDDRCTEGNSMKVSLFTAFLDWLQPRAAAGTVVRTVGQVMAASGDPVVAAARSPRPSSHALAPPSLTAPTPATRPSPTPSAAQVDTEVPGHLLLLVSAGLVAVSATLVVAGSRSTEMPSRRRRRWRQGA